MLSILDENKIVRGKIYRAIVVNNEDPNKLQRVRIRLPQYPTNLPDDCLPWAVRFRNAELGMGNTDTGTLSVPAVGSYVNVIHYNDQYSPVYFGIQSTVPANLVEDGDTYPNCYGTLDTNGNYLKMDMINKLLHVLDESEIQVTQTGDIKFKMNGKFHIQCTGMQIESPEVHITGSSIITNAKVSTPSVNTNTLVADNGTISSINASGLLAGTLHGQAEYALTAGMTPGQLPAPTLTPAVVNPPTAPEIDF